MSFRTSQQMSQLIQLTLNLQESDNHVDLKNRQFPQNAVIITIIAEKTSNKAPLVFGMLA